MSEIAASGPYWSPVLEGESGTVEVFAPTGVDPAALSISVPKVAHLLVAGAGLRQSRSLFGAPDGIGHAGA